MAGRQGQQRDERPGLAGVPGELPHPSRQRRPGRGRPGGRASAHGCSPMAPAPVQTAQPKPVPAPAAAKPMARPTGAGQFTTEYEAKARCPTDTVVWLNTKSRIYHYPGTRSYGTTKQGAYMCEADAVQAGDRASKSRIGKKAQQQ